MNPSTSSNDRSKQNGFNLIELMIVVAIIGIIAAIAYPSYLSQIQGTRRADCSGALVSLANAMERHYSVNGTYVGAADFAGVPVIFSTSCPVDGGTASYNFTIIEAATTFTLNAAPAGPQVGDKCGTLTLSNTGAKNVTGATAGTTWQQCW